MPINSGRYFANPAIGKAHEKSASSEQKPMPEAEVATGGAGHSHPPAHTVSVHKAGGKFHSTGYHDQGTHTSEHDSQDAAFGHAKDCMGAGESGGMDYMGGMK